MQRFIFFLILFGLESTAFAWNTMGHKVIALIAYQQLIPAAREKMDALSLVLDPGYPPLQRFLYEAVWPDFMREGDHRFAANLHYIDYQNPAQANVVTAIRENQKILFDRALHSNQEQARALGFLIHFVSDVHQPLHCMQDYHGGNLFWIKTPFGEKMSLHHYWEGGLGLFLKDNKRDFHYQQALETLAQKIQGDYPLVFFSSFLKQEDPQMWAKESFSLAKNNSYELLQYREPSSDYLTKNQFLIEARIALAAYRLASVLNRI